MYIAGLWIRVHWNKQIPCIRNKFRIVEGSRVNLTCLTSSLFVQKGLPIYYVVSKSTTGQDPKSDKRYTTWIIIIPKEAVNVEFVFLVSFSEKQTIPSSRPSIEIILCRTHHPSGGGGVGRSVVASAPLSSLSLYFLIHLTPLHWHGIIISAFILTLLQRSCGTPKPPSSRPAELRCLCLQYTPEINEENLIVRGTIFPSWKIHRISRFIVVVRASFCFLLLLYCCAQQGYHRQPTLLLNGLNLNDTARGWWWWWVVW